MTDMDRDHLIGDIVDHLGKAQRRIQLRQAALFFKADPDYGRPDCVMNPVLVCFSVQHSAKASRDPY
jgi:catalase